tara:strand:+ start:2223 stop:2942 length:720 start_codon:yes stop_codon:yes gene_type:complete
MKIESWIYYGVFAFSSTLAVYNGQRLFKSADVHKSPWLGWVRKHQKMIFLLVFFSIVLAGLTFLRIQKMDLTALALLLISGLVSVFYVFRIKGKNMRELPFIKIHLIAFTWVVVLIVFPLINENSSVQILPMAFSHYLYVIAVTIPFDIRDLKYDAPNQKTIPQVIGVKASKILAISLLVSFFCCMILQQENLAFNAVFYCAVLLQMILLAFMNEKRSDFYCAGLIDGTIALLGLSYFL